MKKILVVEASPNGQQSTSRQVSNQLLTKLKSKHQGAQVKIRDLSASPVPHLSGQAIQAFYTPADKRTPELDKAASLSDELTQELLWADEIILSVPMWNFGIPSVMKAWIDHVSRAGLTFSFGPTGLVGLAAGRKVYLVVSSGSVYTEGAFAAFDQLVPYIKTFFAFIGITDVQVVRVEGVNDPAKKASSVVQAEQAIQSLLM